MAKVNQKNFNSFLRRVLNMSPSMTELTPLPQFDVKKPQQDTQLYQAVYKYIRTKQELWRSYKEIADFYISELILTSLQTDVFYRFKNPEEPLFKPSVLTKGEVNKDKTTQAMEALVKLKIPQVFEDLFETLCVLGEFLLKLDFENDQIDDTFPQESWRAVYSRGELTDLVRDVNTLLKVGISRQERLEKADNYVVVSTYKKHKRLLLQDKSGYPYYVYEGQGIFSKAVIDLIRSLSVMEKLIPISSILSIANRQVVYLRFPAGASVPDAFKLAREWEGILNEKFVSDNIDDVLDVVGQYKVVPIFGEKGTMDFQEIPKPDNIDLDQINQLKTNLAMAVPIPLTYFGLRNTSPELAKEIAVKYKQFLKALRGSLSVGVRDVLDKYLRHKEILTEEDQLVVTSSVVTGSDDMLMMDYLDTVNMVFDNMSRALDSMVDLMQKYPDVLEVENLRDVVNNKFRVLTGDDVIKPDLTREEIKKISQESGGGF